eukprot:COSAG01_NODE_72331_length_253_cov_0.675325_1_plen_36_part_10
MRAQQQQLADEHTTAPTIENREHIEGSDVRRPVVTS